MIRVLLALAITSTFTGIGAQPTLFYTDFNTEPTEIAASATRATVKEADDTLLYASASDAVPKETVVDGYTFSVAKQGAVIVISKQSQKPVQAGDYDDATNGRCGLKQGESSITLPKVTGPCTITYHAASSSSSATGRGIVCTINGTAVPEASFSELLLDGTTQATRKKEFGIDIEGDVVIKLAAVGGGIYLYNIKVVSGSSSSNIIHNKSALKAASPSLRISGLKIYNDKNKMVQILNPAGVMVVNTDQSMISLQNLVKGAYIVRAGSGTKSFSLIR